MFECKPLERKKIEITEKTKEIWEDEDFIPDEIKSYIEEEKKK